MFFWKEEWHNRLYTYIYIRFKIGEKSIAHIVLAFEDIVCISPSKGHSVKDRIRLGE